MAAPGSLASQVPPGPDHVIRKIADVERSLRELAPSIAASFGPVIADLQAKQAALEEQQAALTDLVGKQVEFGAIGMSTTAFEVTASYTQVASGTMDIPLGFTRCAILGMSSIGAWNGSATGDYLYMRTVIDGAPGAGMPDYAGAGAYASLATSAIRTMTDLTPGGTISVAIECRGGAWGSSAANIANIDVIALFRR